MSILSDEITNDPLARGYAGMTDAQVAADMNTANRATERDVVPSYEVFEAIDPAEYVALTNAEKSRVGLITAMGSVNLKGSNTRATMAAIFGAGTTSRANLLALQAGPNISRGQELGLGRVKQDHVRVARL